MNIHNISKRQCFAMSWWNSSLLLFLVISDLPITASYCQTSDVTTRSSSHSQKHQWLKPPLSSVRPLVVKQSSCPSMNRNVDHYPLRRLLLARRSNTQEEEQDAATSQEEDPLISELDARVLRSMLQDQDKLDLGQEENMRRLLERGVGPKTAQPLPRQDLNAHEEDDSEYSSQVFKKLTDTKLWKVLKRTTEDFVESAKIFVINRIERDAKLLASVGLFAWDRAVRDVARALPAASSKARVAVGLLTNSSSTTATDIDQPPMDLFEELNTPLDEIKSVTQAIGDILSGEVTMVEGGGGGRRLRTLAPAGQVNNAERQRRAYQRRKKTTLQEEKEVIPNIGKVVGGLADATWEIKRELQVETSQPGYKTEPLRNAIEAGATQTGKLLQAVKEDGWEKALLSPLKRQKLERQLKAAVQQQSPPTFASRKATTSSIPVEFLLNLVDERARVVSRLRKCIEQPEATWLDVKVIQRAEGVHFEEQNLRAVVEIMIQTRDEIKTMVNSNSNLTSTAEMFDELRQVKTAMERIQSKASQLISPVVGDALFDELVGTQDAAENDPIMLSLDELEDVVMGAQQAAENVEADNIVIQRRSVDASVTPASKDSSKRAVVDVMPETPVSSRRKNFWRSEEKEDDDDSIASFQVEIVSDDDFGGGRTADSNTPKTVEAISEDLQQEKEEPNFVIQMTLRSLDVVFFVVEKVVLVAFPKLFKVGKTMSTRIDAVGRSGLGRKGWQRIAFTEEGVRRY